MKKFGLLALSIVFAALFSVTSFAQVQPGAGKIGWIITGAFENDKEGITRIVSANKTLETEMTPRANELKGIQTRLQTLADDIKKLQAVPVVDQKTIAAKQDEGERLQTEFKRKQEDAQAAFERRRGELLGPIYDQIGKALDDYAKQKGYTVILDVSALGQPNAPSPILVLDPSANITKDFITFFNARPATTASTTRP
jgi:Skp family chaperone for outer membrane proteins